MIMKKIVSTLENAVEGYTLQQLKQAVSSCLEFESAIGTLEKALTETAIVSR